MKKVEVSKGLFIDADKVFAVDVFENTRVSDGAKVVKIGVRIDAYKNNNFYTPEIESIEVARKAVADLFPNMKEYAINRFLNVDKISSQRVYEKDGKVKVAIDMDLSEREDSCLFSDEFTNDDLTQQGAKDAQTKAREYVQTF